MKLRLQYVLPYYLNKNCERLHALRDQAEVLEQVPEGMHVRGLEQQTWTPYIQWFLQRQCHRVGNRATVNC